MLWVKAFHIVFVTTWFAALFYLPRLFVYHAMCEDEQGNDRFKVMERKLYRVIMQPSAVATLILGGWLLSLYTWEMIAVMYWLHIKLIFVVLLLGYHYYCGYLLQQFSHDQNKHTHVFYRYFNELPVLILPIVVIMVVVKPF